SGILLITHLQDKYNRTVPLQIPQGTAAATHRPDPSVLRNMMERLALFLSVDPAPTLDRQFMRQLLPELMVNTAELTPSTVDAHTLQDVLARFKGDKSAAARYLGISRTTLWRRLKAGAKDQSGN
ncbi:hypothetical protein MJN51_20490, partial [Salmonella enterica subsp. enterica serovar Kentucky]|nr:hypothetical protein [Salmonella enterica subsp. enterica serovar Kentucky]